MSDEILVSHGHTGDPHRRWLRRTYQEGSRFRFLATRGGRPPRGMGPRQDLTPVRERAKLVRVMREEGLAALVPQRRGPRYPAPTHPAWIEQVVIAVRLHTYWNAKRISAELRRRGIAEVGQGGSSASSTTSAPAGPPGHASAGRATSAAARTRSGTSTSKARSSSSSSVAATSRPGSSAWSMTTRASSSACVLRARRS